METAESRALEQFDQAEQAIDALQPLSAVSVSIVTSVDDVSDRAFPSNIVTYTDRFPNWNPNNDQLAFDTRMAPRLGSQYAATRSLTMTHVGQLTRFNLVGCDTGTTVAVGTCMGGTCTLAFNILNDNLLPPGQGGRTYNALPPGAIYNLWGTLPSGEEASSDCFTLN